MIKHKLIKKRKEQMLTQEEMAFKLGMDTSGYNRRENGIIKISKKEWDKIAKELGVDLEKIYEPEDGVYFIHSEHTTGNINSNNTSFNGISEYTFEIMKKYIKKIEEENQALKEQLKASLKE